jgi:trehalose utilization protein
MADKIRVTVWNEGRHEKTSPEIAKVYPQGIHGAVASALRGQPGFEVRTATLDEPEHGLTQAVLANTDVLTWWGHMAHGDVKDEIVDRVQQRVLGGMGLIVLHSGHFSKIFRRLMGTNCSLKWREIGEKERVWVTAPGHPIVEGLGEYFELPHTEMYGEFFDIPQPDVQVFISWYPGGEVFRSGCAYLRGRGKVFYFSPGHETFPIYYQKEIQRVLVNAVRWAAPVEVVGWRDLAQAPHVPQPMEPVVVK